MIYDIKAIPTMYKEIMFRSRLEAKWAVFFDLCGWKWEYEPFDLEGWCPDFGIRADKGAMVLIEVKPLDFVSLTTDKAREEYARTSAAKAVGVLVNDEFSDILGNDYLEEEDTSIAGCEVIVVGLSPFESECFKSAAIGIFTAGDWGPAGLDTGFCDNTGRRDFYSVYGSYHLRVSGLYDGDHYLNPMSYKDTMKMWNQACNEVQWKPKSKIR